MAGANKSNSLKAKKRKLQDQDKAFRIASDKKKKYSQWKQSS